MLPSTDVVVVGAGQAGLAAAKAASAKGLSVSVLEASDLPAGSWPSHYDSLTLFSPARYSSLKGLPFDGDKSRYPTRDEVAAYLVKYAATLNVPIYTQSRVSSARRVQNGFQMEIQDARALFGRSIIAASGTFGRPYLPSIAGLCGFRGEVRHSSEYRSASLYIGKNVLVVGGGNSAMQIAAELAAVARVTIASRRPIEFTRLQLLGQPYHFWLRATGADFVPIRFLLRRHGTRVVDSGYYRTLIKTGVLRAREIPVSSRGSVVEWRDGSRSYVDALILATGYRPNVDWMTHLNVLSPELMPVHKQGIAVSCPGIGWVGLPRQRTRTSAMLRGVNRDAEYVVARIAKWLRDQDRV